jgi:tetratricopeptide (TPR) repeat protein
MPVNFEVKVESLADQSSYRLTWRNLSTQTQDAFVQSQHALTREEVEQLWLEPQHQLRLGQKLFRFLDGDARHLQRALYEAAQHGEPLTLHVRPAKELADWPFELLAQDRAFLLPGRLHLLRQVSDWGAQKTTAPANRPLRLLFMACSALDVKPELDFEREEETIFRVTEKLAIEMEVEDSGALAGLREQLAREAYDVVHLSGHADIDKNGRPFFIMETETGRAQRVTPSELWREALIENPPGLLFLSGCRTGETPGEQAATSFAQHLVEQFHVPAVLSWGRSVSDQQATIAEQMIYRELSRGRDLLSAVQRARQELLELFRNAAHQAWPLLRLYSDGRAHGPLVQPNQKVRPKPRQMVHTMLQNSQVKILATGFVGRRRQMQQGVAALKDRSDKVGALLHGAGGLGKSCLAGKLCERFSNHVLIVVHGRLNAITLHDSLKDAFIAANDGPGLEILAAQKEMPDKLAQLCATCFKEKNYLFVLDDFEQNLAGAAAGAPGPLLPETAPLLQTLLHYLPLSGKMTQLLLTCRYEFALTENTRDLVAGRLEKVALHSFQLAEQQKKARELAHIFEFLDSPFAEKAEVGAQLLAAGHGNPRLMEELNHLVGKMPEAEVADLLAAVRDQKEDFIQRHVIRKLLQSAGEQVENFLRRFSVYRLPVEAFGAECIVLGAEGRELGAEGVEHGVAKDWRTLLNEGVRLSLVEHDHARNTYWLTPLLREELWHEIQASSIQDQASSLHEAAFAYYEKMCGERERIDPILTEEWIYQALGCGREEVAADKGGDLIKFFRDNLAYLEAKRMGEWILSAKQQPLATGEDAFLLNEFSWTLRDLGDPRSAVEYGEQALNLNRSILDEQHPEIARTLGILAYALDSIGEHKKAITYIEQALAIDRAVYGDNHPKVATWLNNLGLAWKALGEHQKAIGYYEQALAIDRAVYGEQHPSVAIDLNNLGLAWNALGEHQKAIGYYEQALAIDRAVYGEQHPSVAIDLNNLGSAWYALGEHEKAIDYFEQALAIWKQVYGEQHPNIASSLNNLGLAWDDLGEHQKAIGYFEQALAILKQVYGEQHPQVAIALNNLGLAWNALGEPKKAIGYYEQALAIDRAVYGDQHPNVAIRLNNLGSAWYALGEHQKAIGYFEQALAIWKQVYGEQHPNIASSLNNLGEAWRDLGEPKKAIGYYEQALAIDRAVYGDQHPDVAIDLNNLGSAYFTLGEKQKAKKYFQPAHALFNQFFGPAHPNTKTAAQWLAACE